MNDALITVIVPVYNVEEYLLRCVDSILEQTYQNLEIILVDDGSTDGCETICDEYANKDERIIVIHKENGGLSDARNAALDIAKGEYITCIDSDDYVTPDYVEYMYWLLINASADLSMCSYKKIYRDSDKLDAIEERVKEYTPEEALENLLCQKEVVPSAWGKLYKRELFEKIRYPKGMHYEDIAVIYKIFGKCKKIVRGEKQHYYYIQRDNSIMNDVFNPKKMHRIHIANELKQYVDNMYPRLQMATSTRCFIAGIQVYREIPYKKEYSEYIDRTWEQIVRYRGEAFRNKNAKMVTRVMALSSYAGKRVLSILGCLYSYVR